MLLKMLVGAINFGTGYFSWTANIPLTYHRNAPFLPKHTHGSTKSSSTSGFPMSTQQKNSSGKAKESTETWLVPTTLPTMLTSGITCSSNTGALQANKGHLKLINNNILYFKFCFVCFFSKEFKGHHPHRITNSFQKESLGTGGPHS